MVLIVYYSKTGFSRKYAQWLGEELGCEVVSLLEAKGLELGKYQGLVFVSGLHAGRISKLEWLKKQSVPGQQKFMLATGATPPECDVMKGIIQNNFPQDYEEYKVFYVQSGLNYDEMPLGDKLLMKMFSSMMKKKKDKNEEEMQMAAVLGDSCDNSRREYLEPLIKELRSWI